MRLLDGLPAPCAQEIFGASGWHHRKVYVVFPPDPIKAKYEIHGHLAPSKAD